jgi:hypothetical protein
MVCVGRTTSGIAAGACLPEDRSWLMPIRHGVRRWFLLTIAAAGMMAVAPIGVSAVSHGPAVVSSAGPGGFASPASSCGNHACVL